MEQIYVSPAGDDSWPGSQERPFATLERARAAAREAGGKAVVHLRGGVHVLTRPFELGADDSGTVYQAAGHGTPEQEEPVISGGREITGWRVRHDGVWLAEVGDLDTRQLYVNGRRAPRAAVPGLPGTVTATETGYVTDSPEPLSWQNVEFVHRGVYPWTEARLQVAGIAREGDSTVITMARPGYEWAYALYQSLYEGNASIGPGLPTSVENDPSFLREPGTFVLDRARPGAHVLMYLPLPGEEPASARVVAPVLETLVRLAGAREVALRGLVFAEAMWLRPGRPEGFVHYHGSGFYEGGPVERAELGEGSYVTYPLSSVTVPACVQVEDADGVEVTGCRFTRIGATGLSVSGGDGVAVRRCAFDTLAGGGVTVTGTRGATIEDNRVRGTGLEFSGSPGIAISGTRGCVVAHNEVTDVPHCGIVAGAGEGTHILHNLTARTLQVLADGGGVYLSGPQGDSAETGAVVRGNVIKDTVTPYNFGLYTDYGASWVLVEENVVMRADNTAVLHVGPPLENVTYRGNFWDADPVGHDDPPGGVTYEGNVTIADEGALTAATQAIQDRAGVRS
ncbi:right-handed parallel beta-helix repeat-containing protein [Nonomuraea sp. NPDC049421]|uniref:right-handed parallel beta-helix repeat-containing protein n=1 Tax=Nonomuraea sp. NPDC049421 TaxID=3155275 RepID=UPI0034183468